MTAAEMPPHVAIVFKELFQELKSAKQQQWAITNYGVLILAAILWVAAKQLLQVPHSHFLLKALVIATPVIGSYLLLRMQSSMARSRRRLRAVHQAYFSKEELRNIGFREEEINNLDKETYWDWWRGGEFLVAVVGVLWIGAGLVYWSF